MAGQQYQKALHAFELGQLNEAQTLLDLVPHNKSDFDVWHLRGAIHASLGEVDLAQMSFLRAKTLKPRDFQVRLNIAKLEKLAGHHEMAETLFLELHKENPLNVAVTNELAVFACLRHDFTEAQSFCNRVLAVQPDNNMAAINMAAVQTHQGKFDTALEYLVAAKDQSDPLVLQQKATILCKVGRYAEAVEVFALLAQSPRFNELDATHQATFHANYGSSLVELGCYDEAEAHYALSREQAPDAWQSLVNLAQYNEKISHDYAKARMLYEEALKLYPDTPDVHDRYANFLHDIGELDMALAHHHKALAMRPHDPEFQYDASKTELALGMLDPGWMHYDARWVRTGADKKSNYPWPEWQGEDGKGKSILVYREQGLGDEIFFANCLPDLAARFSQVVYACHPKLVTLFSRSYPEVIVVPNRVPRHDLALEQFDFQVAVGSLPRWLRPTIDSFPRNPRLLQDDVIRTEHWRQRFSEMGSALKVGIAWRSGVQNKVRDLHYLTVQDLVPVLSVPGVNFINMQYHLTADERIVLESEFGGRVSFAREVDLFNDLDAQACLIKACDLVVAPDTSLYTLAGALGVPTLHLNAVPNDYFMLGSQVSPWFPSATNLAKQPDEPWSSLIEQVVYIITQLANEKMLSQGLK